MAELTPTDVANLKYIAGFRARLEGEPRPASGHKRKGWDAADTLAQRGGYGTPAQ